MVQSRALVQFDEKPYQVFFHDFRIFIQGVEVTDWVVGQVTISKANRDGSGVASFQLDNAMDRFVITDDNLRSDDDYPNGKWRLTNDRYSESAKYGIYLYKKGANEVTIDRVVEQFNRVWDYQWDLVKDLSKRELNRSLGSKISRQNLRKYGTESLRRQLVGERALESLPPESFSSKENRGKLVDALAEKYSERGDGWAPSSISEFEAQQAVMMTNLQNRQPRGNKAKRRVIDTNPDDAYSEIVGKFKSKKITRNPIDPDNGDSRWPMQERSLVFHKNDPLRIFLHNPLTEGRPSDDYPSPGFWLYGFTGFIDQYPVQNDYINGESTLTIQCYDIRALMQKMRVQTNSPEALINPAPLFGNRSGIFADNLGSKKIHGHPLARESFEDAVSLLFTGTKLDGAGGVIDSGVGKFKLGKIVTYPRNGDDSVPDDFDDPSNIAILEEWHTLCLNGPPTTDKGEFDRDSKSIARLSRLTDKDVLTIGTGTTTDDPNFSPLAGRVHFLLPEEGTAARTLVQSQIDSVMTGERDFSTRFEVITDFCSKLDYEFTILPNGDAAFEFPMYDFKPEDFGDWSPVFQADDHLMGGSISDESNDIVTAIIVNGGMPRAETDLQNRQGRLVLRGVVQSSLLASRVGVVVDTVSLPFVRNRAKLRDLALVEFQKRMANANAMDMEFAFRPFLMPNRPMYNAVEQRLGLLSNVTETLQLFSTASTAGALRYIRTVRDDGSFRYICGNERMPISYRKVFPGNTKTAGNTLVTGIRTDLEVDDTGKSVRDNDEIKEQDVVTDTTNNDDRPPVYVKERRPGSFYALTPNARQVADSIAKSISGATFTMTNAPYANGRTFAILARDEDGHRVYSDVDRKKIAMVAQSNSYTLIDTGKRFVFEPRKPNQPDFIVRADNA